MDGCRIKLVSRAEFNALKTAQNMQRINNAGFPWHVLNAVRRQNLAYTEGAADCAIFGVQNGRQVSLFHLPPETLEEAKQTAQVRDFLTEDTVEFKKTGTPRVYLTGGIADSKDSLKLRDFLSSVAKQLGIKQVTQIWGRINEGVEGPTDALFNPQENTMYLHAQLIHEDDKDVLTLRDLKRTFKKIELADGDELETAEGVFTRNDLSRNVVRKLFSKIA